MAFIPGVNVVMAELRYIHLGQKMENTLYFLFGLEPEEAALTSLGTALYNWWGDNIAPLVSSQCGLLEVFLTDLTTDESIAIGYRPETLVFGAQTTDPLPGNVTIAIKFSTSGRGRSSRGRNYIVGLVETQSAGNAIASSVVEDFVTAYNLLPGIAEAEDCQWVVFSRHHNNAPRTTGLAIPITGASAVDDNVDSQRRRLAGRGT